MVILDGKFPYISLNATLNGRMKHRLLVPWMGISLSISNSVLHKVVHYVTERTMVLTKVYNLLLLLYSFYFIVCLYN
jgi:hypothetical protein